MLPAPVLKPIARPKILLLWPVTSMRGGNIVEPQPLLKAVGGIPLMPTLGLLTVAGAMPKDWEMKLIDLNRRPLRDEELAWADYVFLSGFFTHAESIHELARRAANAGKPVILGGQYVSFSRPTVEGVTSVCYGELEGYADLLIADLLAGTPRATYGDSYGDPDRERPPMERSPIPRFDLLDNLDRYFAVSIQTSRGCPFACDFCEVPDIFGRKMRYKSPEQLKAELDALHLTVKRGLLMIWDDNFIGSPKQAKVLLRAFIEWQEAHGFPYVLMPQVSTNVADDPELLDLMFQANCRAVLLGIETVNEESLEETHKYQNLKRSLVDRCHTLIRAGIEVYGYFIVGFDHDDTRIFDAQRKFIEEARIPIAEVSILIANVHTGLHRRIKDEGRMILDPGNVEETRVLLDYLALGVSNFKTNIPPAELQSGYAELLEKLYEPTALYSRVASFVEMLPDRDKNGWDRAYYPLTWNVASLYIFICCVIFLPQRRALLRHAFRLSRGKGQAWRFHRFILAVMSSGLSAADYAKRVARIRGAPYRELPLARGEMVAPPRVAPPRARLPVVT